MNSRKASYNFPRGFLWGIVPDERFMRDRDFALSTVYKLRDKQIGAIRMDISWPTCEPLKGNFDESYIDSIRQTASRIRSQNIEPVVMLNTAQVPQWQNLDHPRNSESNPEDRISYTRHLVEALIPYTKFFCINGPAHNGISRKNVDAQLTYQTEIRNYAHELSESARVGLSLSESFLSQCESSVFRIFFRGYLQSLHQDPMDFLGISTQITAAAEKLQAIFGIERQRLMILSDHLKSIPPDEKSTVLTDKVHEIWSVYQKGWPILGCFSETDPESISPDGLLYINSCKNNALEISTDSVWLSEKWQRFLRD